MIKIFGFAILFSIGGILTEKALYVKIPSLSEPSSSFPSLPRSFGIFVAILTAFNFWTITYGLNVGIARKKYKEMAEKHGEKDTEMRYNLPNLYVDGNTKPARAFNCVQRSHQQMIETLTQFNISAMLSALNYPVVAAFLALLHLISRKVWCRCYAGSEGEPGKRYDHSLSKHIWTSLLGLLILSLLSGMKFFLGNSVPFL
jgi:glutathione S-transferase